MSRFTMLKDALGKLGLAGAVGVGLIVAAAVFYLSVVVSLSDRKVKLQERVAAPFSHRVPQSGKQDMRDDLAPHAQMFYASLPDERVLPKMFRSLFLGADRHKVVIQRGTYEVVKAKLSRLKRYEMTLSIFGPDGDIRKFIGQALQENPHLILEQVTFTRKTISDALAQSEVRFGLILRGQS